MAAAGNHVGVLFYGPHFPRCCFRSILALRRRIGSCPVPHPAWLADLSSMVSMPSPTDTLVFSKGGILLLEAGMTGFFGRGMAAGIHCRVRTSPSRNLSMPT